MLIGEVQHKAQRRAGDRQSDALPRQMPELKPAEPAHASNARLLQVARAGRAARIAWHHDIVKSASESSQRISSPDEDQS
jgi:hypothetical protein